MTGYVAGLLTLPALVLAGLLLWHLDRMLARVAAVSTFRLTRKATQAQRIEVAAMTYAATKVRTLASGDYAVLLIHGQDADRHKAARGALDTLRPRITLSPRFNRDDHTGADQ